jgi:hypothetical protein
VTAMPNPGAATDWDKDFRAPPRVFRLPRGPVFVSFFAVIALGLATAFMGVMAALSFRWQWGLGLFMLACTAFMGALTLYVGRDFWGKWRLRIVLGADALTLDLPARRSLIHRPPAQHLIVPYADVEAIETRLEAYGSLGMEVMQRAYVLHRKNGDLIFLFEERALATALESSMFRTILADLLARSGAPLRDHGMVEGRGGVLAVWGTKAPDWATPSLSIAQQIRLWRRAAATGAAAMVAASMAPNTWLGGLRRRRPSTAEPPPTQDKKK